MSNISLEKILSMVDHTLLTTDCTWPQIKQICDDAAAYKTASVCIPPSYVRRAKEYFAQISSEMKVCTVIGFPNGYNTTAAKVFEAQDAIQNGADEIDMVINVGAAKDGDFDFLLKEISAVKAACGEKTLKVIIEVCLLSDEEKIQMCKVVTAAGVDFIKTSTGFSKGGATFHDAELMVKNIGAGVQVKAAGGISSLDDAQKYIEIGCTRLGTSRIVSIAKNTKSEGY